VEKHSQGDAQARGRRTSVLWGVCCNHGEGEAAELQKSSRSVGRKRTGDKEGRREVGITQDRKNDTDMRSRNGRGLNECGGVGVVLKDRGNNRGMELEEERLRRTEWEARCGTEGDH
jgi:hypothetical protein